MSMMKPIQATPVLSGKDAEAVIKQAEKTPSEKAIQKNIFRSNILNSIRKK